MKPYELVMIYENRADRTQDMCWHEFDVDRPPPAVGDIMRLIPLSGPKRYFTVKSRTWEYEVSANLETYVKLEVTLEAV